MREPHRIRPLVRPSMPHRHVVMDVEADSTPTPAGYRQAWALGVTHYFDRNDPDPETGESLRAWDEPEPMWHSVLEWCKPRSRVVVWTHGLAYDLRVSRALSILPRLGAELDGITLERTAAWATFRAADRTVVCADLWSWLPTSLRVLGHDLGLEQFERPDQGADRPALLRRCERDVQITSTAVRQLLRWLEDERLGPFRSTGAGQSYAAFRARFMRGPLQVHADAEALGVEREAAWTGRCEAWRHGDLSALGPVEYDLHAAYCHIAAECAVPIVYEGQCGPLSVRQARQRMRRGALLAEVDVATERPVVPAGNADRILWPVGRFRTVLWDPELTLLLEAGADVTIRRAWRYYRAPALAGFAAWVLDRIGPSKGPGGAVERHCCKHWSRTLVGRFAMRYRAWEPFGTAPWDDLALGHHVDHETGEVTDLLHVGNRMMTLSGLIEPDNSMPQITSWVMSEARARLWRLMQLAGTEHLLYTDTDSLIVDAAGARRLDAAIAAGDAYSLRRRARYSGLVVHGPRHLHTSEGRKVAGVPTGARQVAPTAYEGEVFRGLRESIARREAEAVVVEPRHFELSTPDPRRRTLGDTYTAPYRMEDHAR